MSVRPVRPVTRGPVRLPHVLDDDVDAVRSHARHPGQIPADAALNLAPDLGNGGAPLERDVQLDPHGPILLDHADSAMPVQGALDEIAHAVDLARRVRCVAREDVAGDARHQRPGCSTSSVASGLAKKRNGTKVVPRPGETCITPVGRWKTPAA